MASFESIVCFLLDDFNAALEGPGIPAPQQYRTRKPKMDVECSQHSETWQKHEKPSLKSIKTLRKGHTMLLLIRLEGKPH